MATPIPDCLKDRPTAAGLVVPFITPVRADGVPLLGAIADGKRYDALVRRACGTCGEPLGSPMVFLLRERDFRESGGVVDGWSAEPAQHPSCLLYSVRACPMLAGKMARYRASDPVINSPGASPQYVAGPDAEARRGHAAEAWRQPPTPCGPPPSTPPR